MKNNQQPQAHYGAINDNEQAAPPAAAPSALAYVQALMQANATPLLLGAGSLLAIAGICSLRQATQYSQLLHQCIQDQQDEAPSAANADEGNHTLSTPSGTLHGGTTIPEACIDYSNVGLAYALSASISLIGASFSYLHVIEKQCPADHAEPSLPGPRG